MNISPLTQRRLVSLSLILMVLWVTGCAATKPLAVADISQGATADYVIGPGDQINIFVWRNADVSISVAVRPDGKVSTPLVEDMVAIGKTPTQLAREIESVLATYIKDPIVTVIVTGFGGPYNKQIRIVGEAAQPRAIPYSENMTLLDVMIAVGGLTEFAAGDRAQIVRTIGGSQKKIPVRLSSLMDGDIDANALMRPGDILLIPESWF
ncbi:MAG: sugar ABC transporter substrate-binding protein [Gammaproteobacteria bacterium]|nr:sugar ABC transporter substrate-binding protein [Gammaproteobacteria bacterium]